jgi:hypothetical protein
MIFGLKNKSGLIIASPATFLIFLLPLPLPPPGLLRLPAILRSLCLSLRLRRLLHARCSLLLLTLFPDYRASLLGRRVNRGWSLNLFATPALWLRSWFPDLRSWCLLNMRCSHRLLTLIPDCRASLLERGFDRG